MYACMYLRMYAWGERNPIGGTSLVRPSAGPHPWRPPDHHHHTHTHLHTTPPFLATPLERACQAPSLDPSHVNTYILPFLTVVIAAASQGQPGPFMRGKGGGRLTAPTPLPSTPPPFHTTYYITLAVYQSSIPREMPDASPITPHGRPHQQRPQPPSPQPHSAPGPGSAWPNTPAYVSSA